MYTSACFKYKQHTVSSQLRKTYAIDAPVSDVWHALTDTEMIRQYFFGTEAVSDWQKGSTIIYRGNWEGKPYEDKGIIQQLIPEKLLTISYWSNRSGKPDIPENYSTHSYRLEVRDNKTQLTLVQEDTYKSDEARNNAWQHWDVVMQGLIKLVEKEHA
jgi:uncharacterized protein YndB with AHSA1/START domain